MSRRNATPRRASAGAVSRSECGWGLDVRGNAGGAQGGGLSALPDAVALPVHLQDVDAEGEAVQQDACQSLRAETSVHSSKGRLVVTRTGPLSYH